MKDEIQWIKQWEQHTADSYYSRKGRTAEVADVKTHFSLFIEQSDDLKYKKWFMPCFHITAANIFFYRDGQMNKSNSW